MSDQSQGPGWWMASDGRWYRPELHPDRVLRPTVPAAADDAIAMGSTNTVTSRPKWVWAAPIGAVCMVVAVVLALSLGGSSTPKLSAPTTGVATQQSNTANSQQILMDDRAAESNLVNAMTEAKALYQITQAYSSKGVPYAPSVFQEQAPEFAWTTGSCGATPSNCLSVQVIDLSAAHDSQGVVITVYSPGTSTCWYGIDVESTPVVIAKDPVALQQKRGGANASVVAGVFYAASPKGTAPASCAASLVLNAHSATWGMSFTGAGVVS